MAITRERKEEQLKVLIDKFAKSQSVVFADYRGLDVAKVQELRGKLREGNAEMKVSKKTLIELAAKEDGIENIDPSVMEGPVAATFSYEDPLSGIQILFKFAKENEDLKLLGGIIDGKVVDSEVINKYAKLPSKEELIAKFMGSIQSPVSGFVGTLNNVMSGFVRVIDAYKNTLPEECTAAPVEEKKEEVAETPAETPVEEPKADDTPEAPAEIA